MSEDESELQYPKNILRIQTDSESEETHYSVFYDDIPEEYQHVAERVLNETPDNKKKGLRKLKEFVEKEGLSATEDILITVLRSCKYNISKSEAKLKRFLKSRRDVIQKLCRVDDKKIEMILDDSMFSVFPYIDKFGRVVVFTKPTLRFDLYSMEDVERVGMSLALYLLTFPMTTVCGMSYLAETKCDSVLILYPIAKGFKPFIYYGMDFPLRVGRLDIINENFTVRLFFNAIRPLLPEKFAKRAFFNGKSYSNLHSVYHPDMLIEEFEGNLGPLNETFYRGRLMNFIQTLREDGRRAGISVI